MHLSHSGSGFSPFWGGGSVVVDSLLTVSPIVVFSNCSMFCCALFCVHFSSSWWGRESWLPGFVCLPYVSWLLCGSTSRCHGFVCSLWLWYILTILTIFKDAYMHITTEAQLKTLTLFLLSFHFLRTIMMMPSFWPGIEIPTHNNH